MLNRKKILLAVDLDNTQFDTAGNWIGGKSFWLSLYEELTTLATANQSELILTILTAKTYADEIVVTAATELKPFLEKYNPHMYEAFNYWCLVDELTSLTYLPINIIGHIAKKPAIPDNAFSHIIIHPVQAKSKSLQKIAAIHQINLDACLLLDDAPYVLEDAKTANLQTVSFECFHPTNTNSFYIDNEKYISTNLARLKKEVLEKFKKILTAPFKPFLSSKNSLIVPIRAYPIDPSSEWEASFEEKKLQHTRLIDGKNWASREKTYYTIGELLQIKEELPDETPSKDIVENIRAYCQAISIKKLFSSFYSQDSILIFDDLQNAKEYVKATRLGNIYKNENCFQSVVFEISIIDSQLVSKLLTGIISYKEIYLDTKFEHLSYVNYVETALTNVNLINACLNVSCLAGQYKGEVIDIDQYDENESIKSFIASL